MNTNGEPEYWFEVGPDVQTNFGSKGQWVEHRVWITNTGMEPDVYLPMFHGNDWWTKFHTVDLRPQGIYNGIDDGSETWWWGPVQPGETKEYAIKVFVPTDEIGAFDHTWISITSDNDDAVVDWVEIWTRNSLPAPFYDDFEAAGDSGTFGLYNDGGPLGDIHGVWTRTDGTRAGVSDATHYSPTHSMFTRHGPVTITSAKINLDVPYAIASAVIQRGGGFPGSELPDGGEDLIVEYSDGNFEWTQWHELDTFYGGGMPGEIFTPYWILPENALTPRFQIRFRQTGGSGVDYDYWHIDDVYIGPPESAFGMLSDNFQMSGPGATASYPIDVTNFARHADGYTVSVEGNQWPTWVIPDTVGHVGPNGPSGTDTFHVLVEVPADAVFGATDIATITVTSLLDPSVSETIDLTTTVGRVHNLDRNLWYWDIQAAVDEANPWDSILTYPGTYHEHVLVEKPLNIFGMDRDTTIVDGQELGSPFTVRSDNVAISGFTIMNSGLGPDEFVPDRAGIKLDGTVECEIFNNLITNNHMGVLSMFGTMNFIAENEFRDNFIGQYSMNGIEDDFSADSDLWIYENDATLETGPGYMQLTPSANSQWGRALFIDEVGITSRFTAEFEYQIGDLGGGGADGLVFMFYKDTDYAPGGGGTLAFGNTPGYGIELDHYAGGTDPSGEHIALIKDSVSTHLASSNQNIDNNVWNRVRVVVDTDTITVYHIDMVTPIFTWTGEIDRTFGGMGFCAATGGARAHHRVRDFSIAPIEPPMFSDIFVGNVVEDNDIGYITMFGHNNLVAINQFANNEFGCVLGLESAIGFNYPSRSNFVFWNDFIPGPDTDELAFDFTPALAPGLNYWDGSAFFGIGEGNYWGDYEAKYPGASESLVYPGIWDTPYEIEPFSSPTQDNFPLMGGMTTLMSPSPSPYAAGGDGLTWFYSVVDSLSALERWSPDQEVESEPEIAPAESGGGAIAPPGTSNPGTSAPVPPAKEPVAQEPDEVLYEEPEEELSDEPVTVDTVQTEASAPAMPDEPLPPAKANSFGYFPIMALIAAIAMLACCAVWYYRKRR